MKVITMTELDDWHLGTVCGKSSGENMIQILPKKNYPPHSVEQSRSWEANRFSASQ